MTTFFYAIHDANGTRIDDTSDYDLPVENLDADLASICAEATTLPSLGPCWKVGDDINGYQYYTVITNS